ncbi:hypothetical protein D9758_014519 [Tetrapyrgos nigripes]|uniref:DUF6534 domain-containing protein n=1 Tax=Tetrapyrgos nigripes TaxID=182062 RepID=A0A8H5CVN6_9AGAR|nr:hypothetical protein D9758_014519 [Tetrapyrgos nigripes]
MVFLAGIRGELFDPDATGRVFMAIWLICSALCDITIAASIMILLPKVARMLIKNRAKAIVLKVMKVVVETGLITVFSAVIQLILFFVLGNTMLQLILQQFS